MPIIADSCNNDTIMRRINIVLISVCLCLAGTVAAQDKPLPDIEELLADNPESIEVFDYISQVGARLEDDPENHAYYEALALAYEYLSIFEKAREAELLALRYYPADAKSRDVLLGNLARIYFRLHKLEEAKQALDQSFVINPDNFANINYLLYYYTQTREYQPAAALLQRLQAQDRVGDVYYNFYLRAREQGASDEDVIKFLRAAVEQSPSSHLALRALAAALRNYDFSQGKSEFPETIRLLEKAAKMQPRYAATCISLADTYLMMAGRADKKHRPSYARMALQWIEKANALEPDNPRIDMVRGNIFLVKEDYDNAIAQLELLYNRGSLKNAVAPQLAQAYERKAYQYYSRGRNLKQGLLLTEESLRLNSINAAAQRTKAGILLKMKSYDAALAAAREGLLSRPDDPAVSAELEKIKTAAEQGKPR